MPTTHKKLKNDDRGVVSLIVAIIIVLMLSLIVLAMSQNARNEQRQALDRQLSDQAFYNAETGVNDVVNYLYNTPTAVTKNTNCDTNQYLGANANQIDGPNGVNRYTCVLYDKAPSTIELDNLQLNDSKLIPIEGLSADGQTPVNVNELTFSWDDANGSGNVSGCNFSQGNTSLPPKLPDGCTVGGLRIDLTPATQGTRDLINRFSVNAFLLPNRGSGADIGSVQNYPDNQGVVGQANCSGSGTRKCSITLRGISTPKSVLHIRSLYEVTDVTISGKDANSNSIRFNNAQIMIDSTGRASDVLKRIQVRVASNPQYRNVESALHSVESICKVLSVTKDPTGSVSSDDTDCPIN